MAMEQRIQQLVEQGRSILIATGPKMGQEFVLQQCQKRLKAAYGHGQDVDIVPVLVDVKSFAINHRRAIDRLARLTFEAILDPHVQRHPHPPLAPSWIYQRGVAFAQVYLTAAQTLMTSLQGTGGFCRYIWLWDVSTLVLQEEQWLWCVSMMALSSPDEIHRPYANVIFCDPWRKQWLLEKLQSLAPRLEWWSMQPWDQQGWSTYCREQGLWPMVEAAGGWDCWPSLEQQTGGHPGLIELIMAHWAQQPHVTLDALGMHEGVQIAIDHWGAELRAWLKQRAPASGRPLLQLRRWFQQQGGWHNEHAVRQAYPHRFVRHHLVELLALGLLQRQLAPDGVWQYGARGDLLSAWCSS